MMNKILNWLIPVRCVLCHLSSSQDFCSDCQIELPWIQHPCTLCAIEISTDYMLMQCGECLIDPPPIDKNLTLFHYRHPVISLITKMKFEFQLSHARALGCLLAERIQKVYVEKQLELPERIIPVPLHKSRLRARGYNQALEIARPIKKQHQIPIEFNAVRRMIPTTPQTLVHADDRKRNVSGVFVVDPSFTASYVAIVDDVTTTFSTISELANVLRRQGVARIDVWCIAKA
jgi:ComF family protein